MKKTILLIFLCTNFAFSQKTTKEERQRILKEKRTKSISQPNDILNFKLVENNIIWQKVYDASGYSIDSLQTTFATNVISTLNTTNLNEIKSRSTFYISNDEVDFRKYGGKWSNTLLYVQYPQNYLVIIDFKLNRYRVTIKEIEADTRIANLGIIDLKDVALKKKYTVFSTNKIVLKGLEYLDKHLLEKFMLSKTLLENDGW